MRTPISYYGGKQRMESIILPMIPQHRIYCEPFFGGGSIFFAKGPSFLEAINDINDNVINFYLVMKERFDELMHEVEMSLMSETMHRKALTIYQHPKGYTRIKRAWAFWYITNFSFANKIGGGWKFDSGSEGSHAGRHLKRRREQFKFYENRLSEVHISCRDALRVITDRDQANAFFYLDPPYPGSDQGHYKGYKMKDLVDLMELLATIEGKFMLSNYLLPEIQELAAKNNWVIREFDMRLSAGRKKDVRKKEALIMNYEPELKLF